MCILNGTASEWGMETGRMVRTLNDPRGRLPEEKRKGNLDSVYFQEEMAGVVMDDTKMEG